MLFKDLLKPEQYRLLANQGGGGESDFTFATASADLSQSYTVKLPVGKTLTVDWGDGSEDSYAGNDAVNVVVTHTYAGAGSYDIKFKDDYLSLTYLICNSNSLTGDISSWSALTNLDYLRCNNGSLTGDISSWPAFVIDAVQRAISESIIEYISQHPTEQPSNTRELSEEDKIEVFSRDECIFKYCPHPELCKDECQSKASTLNDKINKDNKVIDKMTDVGKFMGKSYGNHTSPK